MFRHILEFGIAKSNLAPSIDMFSSVNPECPFFKLLWNMRHISNLSRLAKKVIKWFNETKASGKSFDYRFTGEESRRFLHNFMHLISATEQKMIKHQPGLSCMFWHSPHCHYEMQSCCSTGSM